eukprot:9492309-Pyramimonas_sp.AAC.1
MDGLRSLYERSDPEAYANTLLQRFQAAATARSPTPAQRYTPTHHTPQNQHGFVAGSPDRAGRTIRSAVPGKPLLRVAGRVRISYRRCVLTREDGGVGGPALQADAERSSALDSQLR